MTLQQKFVPVQESDLQQLALLARIIAEGKFEIKGDAILTVAGSLRYLAQLTDRVKNAAPLPQPEPAPFEPPVAPTIEVDTSNLKAAGASHLKGRKK